MTKLYVVTETYYDESEFIGVFSTKEKAKEFIKVAQSNDLLNGFSSVRGDSYNVDEVELDPTPKSERDFHAYLLEYHIDSDKWMVSGPFTDTKELIESCEVRGEYRIEFSNVFRLRQEGKFLGYWVIVENSNLNEAVKIASELVLNWIKSESLVFKCDKCDWSDTSYARVGSALLGEVIKSFVCPKCHAEVSTEDMINRYKEIVSKLERYAETK